MGFDYVQARCSRLVNTPKPQAWEPTTTVPDTTNHVKPSPPCDPPFSFTCDLNGQMAGTHIRCSNTDMLYSGRQVHDVAERRYISPARRKGAGRSSVERDPGALQSRGKAPERNGTVGKRKKKQRKNIGSVGKCTEKTTRNACIGQIENTKLGGHNEKRNWKHNTPNTKEQ